MAKSNAKIKLVKGITRIATSELARRLIKSSNDVQPDKTELLLNDLDEFGSSDDPKECTFRLTASGKYFVTGADAGESKSVVQLGFPAKKRLCIATGGKVLRAKNKAGKFTEELLGGEFSENDLRRCFDYIKSHGYWVKETDIVDENGDTVTEPVEFVIDTNNVNDSTRGGARWPALNSKKSKKEKGTRKTSETKAISISNPGKDSPKVVKKNGAAQYESVTVAKNYYTPILRHIAHLLRTNGNVDISISINGKVI